MQKRAALIIVAFLLGTIFSAGVSFDTLGPEGEVTLDDKFKTNPSSNSSSGPSKNWTSANEFTNLVSDSGMFGANSCRNTGSSTIVAGEFEDYSVTLGNHTVFNNYTTRTDIVFGSYNDNGTWNWVKSIGGEGGDSISHNHPYCNDKGDFVMATSGTGLVSYDKDGNVNWLVNVSTRIFDANDEFLYINTAQNISKIDWDGNLIWEKQRPLIPYECGSNNWGNTLSPKLITENESIVYTEICQMEDEMTIGDCNVLCWEYDIEYEWDSAFYVVAWNNSGNLTLGWSDMIQTEDMRGNFAHNVAILNNELIIWGAYRSYELDLFGTSYYNIEAGNEYAESYIFTTDFQGNISSLQFFNGTGRHEIKSVFVDHEYMVMNLWVGQQYTIEGITIQPGHNYLYFDFNLNQTTLLEFNNNNHIDISSVSFDEGGNVSFIFYDVSGGYQFGNHSISSGNQVSVIATYAGDVAGHQPTPTVTELSNWTISPSSGPSEGGTELTITGDFSSFYNLEGGSLGAQTEINHSWSSSLIRDLGGNIRCFSIAADSNDNLHVAYIEDSKLYYVSDAQDENHNPGYALEITTTTGGECEIGIDSGGNPRIAYRSSSYIMYTSLDNGNWTIPSFAGHLQGQRALQQMIIDDNDDVYLLAYDSANSSLKLFFNEGSLWSNYTIDNSGSVRPYGASMYIDNSGYIHVAYYHDYGNNNLDLRYTKLDMLFSESITGFWKTNSTIDSSVINVCQTSIVVDSNYVTHVTYARETEIDTTSINLIHAYANNTSIFTSELIDSNQAGGSSSMVIDNEDNLYVIYTREAADFEVRLVKYDQNSWTLIGGGTNESSGTEIHMVLDSSKNLHAVYIPVILADNYWKLEYLFGNSGLVQYGGLYAQFDEYGNTSIQFINNSTIKLITPVGPVDGKVVNITIRDELGNGYLLNAAYTYLPASSDIDNDGFDNELDDCPDSAGNSTIDQIGCPDSDGDGYSDSGDLFPSDSSEWADSDGDGVGNNGDAFPTDYNETQDSDGDGVGNNGDAFPNDANETTDSDGDGVGDNSDAFPNNGGESIDTDGDGVGDNSDEFPGDANETQDSDGDGIGDNEDEYPFLNNYNDSDGDSFFDLEDDFPNDPTQWSDYDGDGHGDNPEGNDPDLFINNVTQWSDADGDGFGDNWGNPEWNATRLFIWPGQFVEGAELADHCPTQFGNSSADGFFGCPDDDKDGIANIYDEIDNSQNQTVDLDTDLDGIIDSEDLCPDSAEGAFVDSVGCLVDSDGDGIDDLQDKCPDTKSGVVINVEGCEVVEKEKEEQPKSYTESLLAGEPDTVLKTVGFGAVIIAVLGFMQTNFVAALLPDAVKWMQFARRKSKLSKEEEQELLYLQSLVQAYYYDYQTISEELQQLKSELTARFTNNEIKQSTREKINILISDLLQMDDIEMKRIAHDDTYFGLAGTIDINSRNELLEEELAMRSDIFDQPEPVVVASSVATTPAIPNRNIAGEINPADNYEYLEYPSGSGVWHLRNNSTGEWEKWSN